MHIAFQSNSQPLCAHSFFESINNFERVVASRAYTTRIVYLNDKYSVAGRTLVQRSEYLFDVISEKCFEMKVWGRKNFTYD